VQASSLQVTGQTNGPKVSGWCLRNGLRASLLALALLSATAPSAVLAQQAGKNDQPVLLNADELTYDETLGVVTASGDVELAQGDRLLLADRVVYNERTRVVTANGNIRLLEPSGDVMFAEYAS